LNYSKKPGPCLVFKWNYAIYLPHYTKNQPLTFFQTDGTIQIESATGKTLDLEITINNRLFRKSLEGDYFFILLTLIPMVTPSEKHVVHKLSIAMNTSVSNI